MLLSKSCRVIVAGLALGAFGMRGLRAEESEAVPSDRLLPPGVLLHVRISDMSDLKERLPKTGFGQMYQDDSMKKVREQIEKKFEEASSEAGEKLGFPLADLLNLPAGEVTIALVAPADQSLAGVAIMEIGDQEETLEKALAKLDEGLTQSGAEKKSETIEDVEVTVYELKKDEEGQSPGQPSMLCYFTSDGVFVSGTNLSVLEEILTRWDGDSDEVLAEEEVYSYIHTKCSTREDDDSAIEWYVDPMGLVTAGLNANEELSTQALMFSAYLPTLGLDKFKGAGGSIDFAEGGYDAHTKSFLYVEQPTSGLLRAFEFPAADLTPPGWVGAEAAQYTAFNWDASGAYTALTEMADTLMNQPGAAEQQMSQLAKQAGFHVKEDIIDHLDGQIVMLGDIDASAEPVAQKILLAVKLKDAGKFQETLNTILEKAGSGLTEREFEGTKVYDIQSPQPNMSPAICLGKDYFIASTHADSLEAVLRTSSGSEGLASTSSYAKVKKLIPQQNSMLAYSDQAKQLKPYFELLKSGKLDGATEGEFDFGVLPDFDKIQKFFSISVNYTIPDEKGAYSEGFMFGGE